MPFANTDRRWGGVAKTLHWVIALLILSQFVLAELAENAGALKRTNPAAAIEQLTLLARHKSLGITILGLALIRIAWRFGSRTPSDPPTMPPWQRTAARVSHTAFYALLFVLPVTGWIMSSASNFPVSWFGLVQLPDLVGADHDLHETFEEVHEVLAWTLASLAGLHVAAALKHHFFDRDDVLRRMLPWGG
jgi:cytochrome b561